MNNNYPDFKPNYSYSNIGNVVGTLTYAKELTRKDGTAYGYEFLVNAQGYGSVNLRIPIMQRAQDSFDNFPVSEKPQIRAGLTQLDQFVTDKGKVYTNATSFIELQEAVTVNGEEMKPSIAGRLAGEVFNLRQEGEIVKFSLIAYATDRDDSSKRAVTRNGDVVDPNVLHLEVHDNHIIGQFKTQVQNGMNIEVGYRYINKSSTTYDEFGFAVNGDPIDRIEVGKLVVHNNQPVNQQPQQNVANGYNNQAANGQPSPQNNNGFGGQQQQQQNDPFSGVGDFTNDPQIQQQVDNMFGNGPANNNGGQGFGFGN